MWWLLLLLVVLRIPTLDRPLSKHHDFNNAVVLINAVSWQQAGGGNKFCFTPVMNFQGQSNKLLEKGYHIDANGNHVYLSFGAGWYALPYFVFVCLGIAPDELTLELLNLLVGLLSTVLLFRLLVTITQNRNAAYNATLLWVLLPTPLWHMGHSYVTTGIMMPVLIGLLQLWYRMAQQSRISWQQYLLFFLLSVALSYFDWIGVFLPAGMAAWFLVQKKWKSETLFFIAIAGLAVISAILLILSQFACHLGWQQVQGYWLSRFSERSIAVGQTTPSQSLVKFIRFFGSGFGPLIMVMLVAVFSASSKRKDPFHWIHFAIGITLVYNLVFLSWSLEHEFAWMVMCLLMILCLALTRQEWLAGKAGKKWTLFASACSLAIYFFINQPGSISQSGQPYNQQKNLGEKIANSIPADAVIFTNLSNAKIEEWYARRTFNQAVDIATARAIIDSLQLPKAFWIEVRSGTITALQDLTPIQK
jgi:MFS family permease